MLAPNNFLSPATGDPILTPSQDMVLGCYYLTTNNPSQQINNEPYFSDFDDVLLAYTQDQISLHTFVWVRYNGQIEDEEKLNFTQIQVPNRTLQVTNSVQIKNNKFDDKPIKYIRTTPGRIFINEAFQ